MWSIAHRVPPFAKNAKSGAPAITQISISSLFYLLSGLRQFIGQQMGLERKIARAHQITVFCGLPALRHVVLNLGQDGRFVRRELALDSSDVSLRALHELGRGGLAVSGVVVGKKRRNGCAGDDI